MKSKILLFILIFFTFLGKAQFYFIEDSYDEVEVKFLRKKIEAHENQTFFNILKIKNPTNRQLTFDANFSYPADWTFMADKNRTIVLNPSDSILIPFRAAPSTTAKGEIGYAIVASLTDQKGNNFKNEYSFVNIPKISDLKFKPVSRTVYFDQLKKNSTLELFFSNSGNTEEFIYITYNMAHGVTTKGAQEGIYKDELTLEANSDTVITFPIELDEKYKSNFRKFHRVQVEARSKDTTMKTSIWAKELEKYYENEIPYNYKMLNIELAAQNLFSEQDPNRTMHISGFLLPKGNTTLQYNYQNYRDFSKTEELWQYSKMFVIVKNPKFDLELGDIPKIMGHSMYGRGGYFEYKSPFNSSIKLMATQSVLADNTKAAFAYKQKIKRHFVEIGTSYEQDNERKVNSQIGFIDLNLITYKRGTLTLYSSVSNAKWHENPNSVLSYSLGSRYYFTSKKWYFNVTANYAPREYFGYLSGRQDIRGVSKYYLSNTKYLSYTLNNSKNNPPVYRNFELIESNINSTTSHSLKYNVNITPRVLLSAGPTFEDKEANNFIGELNNYLRTNSYLGYFAIRTRNTFTQNTFSATMQGGYNTRWKATLVDAENAQQNNNWFSGYLSLSFRSKVWGVNSAYYHGPNSITQQYNYFTTGYEDKSVRVMPYVDFFVIPKYIRFASRPSYIYDIPGHTGRLTVNSEILAYPGKNWELILANTLSNTTTKDLAAEEKTSFSTAYFEFRVRKSFDFNQPKYQYHDLRFFFFKDLNGNNIMDEDEPGVKDVLLMVQKDDQEIQNERYNTASHFMPMDLLSDMNGYVRYENIPNGFYIVEYKPIGKMEGAFTSEKSIEKMYVDGDKTFYIPFHENNKLFGKVILNRSKLSNLGKIDPANIKVTAEDTKGKKYSTLTDAQGNFSIFVPNVDKYKVHVNNIFYENFELEQNDYEVQLNGYRQFEVNFVFNEKRRKLRFSSTYEYGASTDGPGIEIIRRTNLSGTVKDATTLKPIVANIRVVDRQGNQIVSTKSNRLTGLFTTSFVAGNDYIVEADAEDYWFTKEKLYDQQVVTFKNLKKDILLKAITVGQLIPMKTLNFEEGETDIPTTAFPELERLLKVFKDNPTVKIAVHGHADDLEIQGAEQDLALERAKIVAKFLIANGYNRVKYVGHANTKPLADNDTEDGRRLNRRVEIVVTGK